MINKLLQFLTICLLFTLPITLFGQQPEYFPDRLIIKYESEQTLQQIRVKTNTDPQAAVQQILNNNGVRERKPLISEQLRRSIQQRNLPSGNELLRIQEFTFSQKVDPAQLAAKINRMPGVEYAEPKFIRKLHYTPNDPIIEEYIDAHNFREAWDLSRGSPEIIIAINDGGVNYTHPELDDNLWINQDEIPPTLRPQVDQNSNGTITSTEIYQYLQDNGDDYNGDGEITLEDALHSDSPFTNANDTDDNGFEDDLFGWDFWADGGITSSILQDNNPISDGTDHGTHVAGIAAAETDNERGIASAAFTATYMPAKTGGTEDQPDAIGFGFNGIIYAAQNGADIINASWGGNGSSQAEQDVINFVTEMGIVVVASSGNEGVDQISFPAGYDNVIGVGSVEINQAPSLYSNYGYSLDVLANGTNIISTSYDDTYVSKSGTSMATPVVSGLAALVKELHPSWSAERINKQIRASSTSIDQITSENRRDKLGRGSINAFRALDTNLPGLGVISHQFINADGNKLGLNESGSVEITLTNYGNSTSSLNIQLQSLSEDGIELTNTSQQLGSIATGDTLSVSFGITITNDFDLTEVPTLKLIFEDSNPDYSDFGIILYENLLYDIMAINNVKTSLAADGTIGFTDPLSGTGGVGFIPREPDGSGGYQEGDNLLFEGGLILEINDEIYDAVRAETGLSRDFIPQEVFTVEPTEDGNGIRGHAQFTTDTDSARQAIIDLEAFAFDEPALSNVIFVKYVIQNPSSFNVLENVYAGLFNDWDIGNSANNSTSFSESDSVLYMFESAPNSDQPVTAVAHLGPISGALAIDNTIEGQRDSLTFGLYDGFTDSEKSSSLKSGTVRTEVENTDASIVTASGPYTINPGAEITIGFVYAFGDDETQLRNQIAEARSRELFPVSPTGTALSDEIPSQTQLFQNYPNPFRGTTRFRLDLEQTTHVTLTVFDVLGRKVQTLADREFEAGAHFIRFDAGNLSSGVYFARLKTETGTQSIPMTLIK